MPRAVVLVRAMSSKLFRVAPGITLAVRLVGGPADGLVLSVPEANLPPFFAVGFPVSRYETGSGKADVRIFRYVSVN